MASLKPEQERIRTLLAETITLLCRSGLNFQTEFSIEALIGITLDQSDVFLVSIKETVHQSTNGSDGNTGQTCQSLSESDETNGTIKEFSFTNSRAKFIRRPHQPLMRTAWRERSPVGGQENSRAEDTCGRNQLNSGSRRRHNDLSADVCEIKRVRQNSPNNAACGLDVEEVAIEGGSNVKADADGQNEVCSASSSEGKHGRPIHMAQHQQLSTLNSDDRFSPVESSHTISPLEQALTPWKHSSKSSSLNTKVKYEHSNDYSRSRYLIASDAVKSEPVEQSSTSAAQLLTDRGIGDFSRWENLPVQRGSGGDATMSRSQRGYRPIWRDLASPHRAKYSTGEIRTDAGYQSNFSAADNNDTVSAVNIDTLPEQSQHSHPSSSSFRPAAVGEPLEGGSGTPSLSPYELSVARSVLTMRGSFVSLGCVKANRQALRRLTRDELNAILEKISQRSAPDQFIGCLVDFGVSRIFYKCPPDAVSQAALDYYGFEATAYAECYAMRVVVDANIRDPETWIARVHEQSPFNNRYKQFFENSV